MRAGRVCGGGGRVCVLSGEEAVGPAGGQLDPLLSGASTLISAGGLLAFRCPGTTNLAPTFKVGLTLLIAHTGGGNALACSN